jgi:hypothetical protein
MQLHDIPQLAIFTTKAISGFSIPIRCIFQLIKISLSGYHRVSQTSEPPFPKNPSFPYPRCCTVQYLSSNLRRLIACMHTCVHNASNTPVPPPRIPDSRENSIAATLHRHRHTCLPSIALQYIVFISATTFTIIHYLSIIMHIAQPQHIQIPHFFPIQYSLALAATGCPMACIHYPATRCRKGKEREKRVPPFCRVRQG